MARAELHARPDRGRDGRESTETETAEQRALKERQARESVRSARKEATATAKRILRRVSNPEMPAITMPTPAPSTPSK